MALIGKKSVGLDVSDTTIELVELKKSAGKIKFLNCNRVILDSGVVENGRIKDKKKLKDYFNKLFSEAKPREISSNKINFALPENQVYIHSFEIDYDREAEIENLVYKEAAFSIPIEKENLWLEFKILQKEKTKQGNKKARILLAAADKEVCKEWQEFFREGNLEIKAFDLPCLASFRALQEKSKKRVAVVDVGADHTGLAIFKNNSLFCSCSINIAGNKFTEAIAQAENISRSEAEKRKKTGGLNMKKKKAQQALEAKVNKLIREISETLGYMEKKYGARADKIILVGGSSKMKGLLKAFRRELDAVEPGKPSLDGKKVSWEYLAAVGSARRELKSVYKNDLRIPLVRKEKRIDFEDILDEEEKNKEEGSGSKKKIIILLSILVLGAVLVLGAYMFRQQEKESADRRPSGAIGQYNTVHNLDLEIPLATNPEEYTGDRVRARTVEVAVEKTGNREQTEKKARELARSKRGSGEVLWDQPLAVSSSSVGTSTGSVATSSSATSSVETDFGEIVFEWLIYSEDGLSRKLTQKIKEREAGSDFIFNTIEKKEVRETDNPEVYLLLVHTEISTK